MTLPLSSLPTLAATLFLLTACNTPVIVANGNGGGGGGGASSTSTTGSTTSNSTTTSGTGGGSNTCVAAGGQCEAITPGACLNGTVGDATQYSCGSGVGVLCCLPCPNPCATVGATRCAANAMQTCTAMGGMCRSWVIGAACAANEGCNSDGTKCIAPASACTTSAECGCGCGCGGGTCHCTGAIPPTCNTSEECGPACSGLICVGYKCKVQACTPGMDQTCNENPGMNAFAGTCNANGTCTCKQGFALKPSGKCG